MIDFTGSINRRTSISPSLIEGENSKSSIFQPLLQNNNQEDMNKLLLNSIKKHLTYGDLSFFEKDDANAAQAFFQEAKYSIELSNLYNIVDSCYYAQNMPYCPVLVENKYREKINQEKGYDGKATQYMLQVWNKQGNLIFQKGLNQRPLQWCIANETLVYLPDNQDQDSQDEKCYYIVNLDDKNLSDVKNQSIIKVNIKGQEYDSQYIKTLVSYCKECLYISQPHKVFILDITGFSNNKTYNDYINGQKTPVIVDLVGPNRDPNQFQVRNHALLYVGKYKEKKSTPANPSVTKKQQHHIMVVCETSDHQLDFCKLAFNKESKEVTLSQTCEIVKRELESDETLQLVKVVYDKAGKCFAMCLRLSGKIDIYWNYNLINAEEKSSVARELRFDDIELTFDSFYLKQKPKEDKGPQDILKIAFQENGKMSLNQAQKIEGIENQASEFKHLFHKKLKSHLNFYSAYLMVSTSFIIAHNDKVFIYNLFLNEISKVFTYPNKIERLFRIEKTIGMYDVAIILKDGSIHHIENKGKYFMNPAKWEKKQGDQELLKLIGSPKQIISNQQYQTSLYILSELDGNDLSLTCLTKGNLFYFEQKHTRNMNSNSLIVPLYCQHEDKDSMFVHYTSENKVNGDNNDENVGLLVVISAHSRKTQPSANLKIKDQFETKQLRTLRFDNSELKNDKIHSAMGYDIDKCIVLVGIKNIYLINVDSEDDGHIKPVVLKDKNITSLQILDDIYCYALVQKIDNNLQQESGVFLFSLKQLLDEQDLILSYKIEQTIESINNAIDFSEDNQRLIYMKNYDQIHIIPPLHRNTIGFIGMLPRSSYLAVKKVRNKFHALDKNCRLTTWNAFTGKIEDSKPAKVLDNSDLSNYGIFGTEKNNSQDFVAFKNDRQQRSLIVSLTNNQRMLFSSFLSNKMNQLNEISGSKSYASQNENDIQTRNYKLIEIQDEENVKVHLTFDHQYFQKKFQKLYISEDCNIMIEKLENYKVLLYQWTQKNQLVDKESISGPNQQIIYHMEFRRRLYDFPHELSELSSSLYLFSPDFKQYFTYDKASQQILLRTTNLSKQSSQFQPRQDRVFQTVGNENKYVDIFKRLKWIDNSRFLICSNHGFEKLYQIDDQIGSKQVFKEITAHRLVQFSSIENAKQMYHELDSLSISDIEGRLKRKHIELSRLRMINESEQTSNNQEHSEYEVLFTVDYNVDNGSGKFVSDCSFSYIFLKIINDIEKNDLQISSLNSNMINLLSLNILPGCTTILHKMTGQSQMLHDILTIYSKENELFNLPFITDNKGYTPLHYCVYKQDFKTADVLIQNLANAPIDHHSRYIKNIIHILIEKEVPSLDEYFKKRVIETEEVKKINRGNIKCLDGLDFGMVTASIWDNENQIEGSLYQKDQLKKGVDPEIKLRYIDLPELQNLWSECTDNLFKTLKNSENLKLFEVQCIRYLIDYHWINAKYYTEIKLLYPFIAYLICYSLYTNYFDNLWDLADDIGSTPKIWLIDLVILVMFSIYFLRNEVRQIFIQKKEYFKEPWNYIDLTPPILILTIATINLFEVETETLEGHLKSIGSLLMWIKLLYFCRIYKATGYLIRIIIKVIFGMKTFLGVFLITILAVSDSYISIMDYNAVKPFCDENIWYDCTQEDTWKMGEDLCQPKQCYGRWQFFADRTERFIYTVYNTYRSTTGGGDDINLQNDGYNLLRDTIILVSSLFLAIVMLNLLISIIGGIFGKIQDNSIIEYYQERASIISENMYLIPTSKKGADKSIPGHLLLVGERQGFDTNKKEEEDEHIQERENQRIAMQEMMQQILERFEKIEEKFQEKQSAEVVPKSQSLISFQTLKGKKQL